jgi:autotransporter passenger strand-loop-strand repeat protein
MEALSNVSFGTAIDTTIYNGGWQSIFAGGIAIDTTVLIGGEQTVGSGGTAIDTIVSSGGSLDVALGGVISNRVISSFGYLFLPALIYNSANVFDGATLKSGAVVEYDVYNGEVVSALCAKLIMT